MTVNSESGGRSILPGGSSSAGQDLVCIVGLACRLPGEIGSPSQLWDFIIKNKSSQGVVPAQRFNMKGFYHPDSKRSGVMSANGGYFIQEDIRQFDNAFFNINNLEATYMDPQQRQLLEQISGTNTGVFVGNFTQDYQTMQTRDPDYGSRYTATGAGTSILANRISNIFNLQGPSFTLDTACSSSLYCFHSAVSAIRSGDCEEAIVAAANLIMSPEQHLGTMKGGILSPTSTCHTFDVAADGYGRAEGINAIYLKPLSSALRDGDKIWAVVRGTATTANGKTAGIALPSAVAQEATIRKAYANAGLRFTDTDYIECHGTGTAVGDPIELDALASCFSPRMGTPLIIGSVKTNLGHSEAASGLTSIIKVALALDNGVIPPTHGVTNLNPKLKLESRNFKVATEVESWPSGVRRASINSFGYGGANAHVVLESANSYLLKASSHERIGVVGCLSQSFILPVSAASAISLDRRIEQIRSVVGQSDTETLARLTFTLTQRRSQLRMKSFLIAHALFDKKLTVHKNDGNEAVDFLPASLPPFAFVFTGQGAQYSGMGRQLLKVNMSFLMSIRQLDGVLKGLPSPYAPEWTMEGTLLTCHDDLINEATRSQTLCTAIQIALVDMLRTWGIIASAVVGHSSGEIAAAYAAGLLTASQAIAIAYFRAMLAVGLSLEASERFISTNKLQGKVCVACVNAPESVTLKVLKSQGVFVRRLETGGRAYHSPIMQEVGGIYEQLLAQNLPETTTPLLRAKMYSSVGYSGDQLRIFETDVATTSYWRENLQKPVQFSSALSNLSAEGNFQLIEIGPHPALKGPIQQIRAKLQLSDEQLSYTSTLAKGSDADFCMKQLAGTLFLRGNRINWNEVNELSTIGLGHIFDLPTYPWDYGKVLWYESRASVDLRNRQHIRHELLGSRQLAGNGTDWSWRNILRLDEMPWIRGHKIEKQIVFPAAGYLAVAIEALSQMLGIKGIVQHQTTGRRFGFDFRQVNVAAALILPEDDDTTKDDVELYTTMSPRRLSTATASSTYDYGGTTMISDTADFEVWATDKFYEKAKEEGLSFEGDFRSLISLSTDGNRKTPKSVCTTKLTPSAAEGPNAIDYPIHPITIDACLQAAIIGSTGGDVSSLRAYLLSFISQARVWVPGHKSLDYDAPIHTHSCKTGVSTMQIDSTLRDPDGQPLVDFKGVRLSLYTSRTTDALSSNGSVILRHPMLCARWKPDITRLHSNSKRQINKYIANVARNGSLDTVGDEAFTAVKVLLDLAGHKNPDMRVLKIVGECEAARRRLLVLEADGEFPQCDCFHTVLLDNTGQVQLPEDVDGPFDLVLLLNVPDLQKYWTQCLDGLLSPAPGSGIIVYQTSEEALALSHTTSLIVTDVSKHVSLAMRPYGSMSREDRDIIIVFHKPSQLILTLAAAVAGHLQRSAGFEVKTISLGRINEVKFTEKTIFISMLEVEHEFLASMSEEDMRSLQRITTTVTDMLWLIGANMLELPDPNMALCHGLSRTLMLEQPSLRFSVLDIGPLSDSSAMIDLTCENVTRCLLMSDGTDSIDSELVQKDGLLHISRFVPETELNTLFSHRLGRYSQEKAQCPANDLPIRLSIGKPGLLHTLYYQQLCEPPSPLPVGFIDVDVKAFSLNAKDIYTLYGRTETKDATTACEFSGIVADIGPGVNNIQVGDKVVVMAPNHFTTLERVPEWAVHKLLPGEDLSIMASLPVVYATALYALDDRASLRSGESILIHSGAGALGVALITIAQRIGATIYTTVSSKAKREFITSEFGIPDTHIFSSRDVSFLRGIKKITGEGVDVVINSLTGELMHASWECIAPFGRFVEVGKREIVDAGQLNMHLFLKNSTFTAFDLTELYWHTDEFYHSIWNSKIKEIVKLYRSGQIKPAPITKFDIAETYEAFRYFSTKDRIGKVVVSLENHNSNIPIVPAPYLTIFDSDKSYLLVGCLGGLGRSLSRWMISRGARKFCFLGRSGCDKPSAQAHVKRLQAMGAFVTVIRGDVSNRSDVDRAIVACKEAGPNIGGVFQAAMVLREALFSRMSHTAWQTAIQPKCLGTWNLHHALENEELDFFLMLSSMSGSIGTPTESNYCAANSFLNAFAHWRRAQGKPATSVGLGMISEVGYLHENPEIEAMLLRKGVQPLDEAEFLQVIDMALSGRNAEAGPIEPHILTGFEPFNFRKLMAQGFYASFESIKDLRMSRLASAIAAETRNSPASMANQTGSSEIQGASSWFNQLPPSFKLPFAQEAGTLTLKEATMRLVKKRFSSMILAAADQIDDRKPLSQFGVDSMMAAELRLWFWNTFRVDVSFLDLLGSQKDIRALVQLVEDSFNEKTV
ncbi:polyketide synthase-like protein [Daldinia caldariorum]|uniref:polyketide synthase-like protein n=1 Tax=Daldinia caldariorum TaxID=326644 RepID=UPI0020087EFA|nr:polyketide synthase-like protein [Daldinia caldariorum]KAI1465640.1 polyketide synthase-like protein [Daldinia caldariorum]